MQQIVIPFRGWNLIAWLSQQGADTRIAVKPICEAIGIAWTSQYLKLKNDPKFNCYDHHHSSADGKQRVMLTLPAKEIQGWLFSIHSGKVRKDIRPLLLEFQKHCFDVIYAATSGAVNAEVMAAMQIQMDKLTALVRDLITRDNLREQEMAARNAKDAVQDLELQALRKENAEYHNLSISNAGRTLQKGHIKN